jgi:hypothetical protein
MQGSPENISSAIPTSMAVFLLAVASGSHVFFGYMNFVSYTHTAASPSKKQPPAYNIARSR